MMYWLDCNLPSEYFVHHIDGNKLNANKSNLVVMFSSAHQSKHNKGKKITEQQKQAIRASNHKRKGKRAKYKSSVTPEMVFNLKSQGFSFNQISKTLNLDWGCVKQRYEDYIHDNPELLEVEE